MLLQNLLRYGAISVCVLCVRYKKKKTKQKSFKTKNKTKQKSLTMRDGTV